MKQLILILSCFAYLASCESETTNPVEPEENKLLGKWGEENKYTIEFLSDGKIIQSFYDFPNINNGSELDLKLKANYNINSNFIEVSDFKAIDFDSSIIDGRSGESGLITGIPIIYNLNWEYSILNDQLNIKDLWIFTKGSGVTNLLHGIWGRTVLYYIVYSDSTKNKTIESLELYEFLPDSNVYIHITERPALEPPLNISITQGTYTYIDNNKLNLFYKDQRGNDILSLSASIKFEDEKLYMVIFERSLPRLAN